MVLLSLRGYSKPEDFEVNFEVPWVFFSPTRIALRSADIPYEWDNISPKFNTNKLRYFDGTKWEVIIFPEGNYDFDDIQDYINDCFQTEDPPINIYANTVTRRTIILLKSGFKVDLIGSGELYKIFGFEPIEINQPNSESKYKANITRGVDRILIHCSAVGVSYINSIESDVIFSFVLNKGPGSILDIEPFQLKKFPLKETTIRKIRMRLTDQNDRPIDLNGNHVHYDLVFLTQ